MFEGIRAASAAASSNGALQDVGRDLESAVKTALAALEQKGVSARDADEFIRDCVFNAWWDWDYEGPSDG
jgi:hypothetical protein